MSNTGPAVNGLDRLTGRQRAVLSLLCKGLRNSEIGLQLGLSERTVKGYVRDLLLLFDVSNRTELAGEIAAELAREGR